MVKQPSNMCEPPQQGSKVQPGELFVPSRRGSVVREPWKEKEEEERESEVLELGCGLG